MQFGFDQNEQMSVEVPDLTVVRDIGAALRNSDDKMLWDAARRAQSQAVFYEQLRAQVAVTTYSGVVPRVNKNRLQYQCALVMVPILLPESEAHLIGSPLTAPVMPNIRNWLQEWFESQGEITMFGSLFGYHDVCMWSPTMLRKRLMHLTDKRHATPDAVTVAYEEYGLPPGAPNLAFIIAALLRPLARPTLPYLDPEGDLILRARISGALQLCSESKRPGPVEALIPGFASEAIADGLDAWLKGIAKAAPIRRWDVQQADQDIVLLQLELGDDATHTRAIPLRAHQLGLDGIEDRIKVVAGLGTGYLNAPQ
jgi:hypothetical protein